MSKVATLKKRKLRKSCGVLFYSVSKSGKVSVFMIKENSPKTWNRNTKRTWGIPKGRPDRGEKCLETALREFKEETGWDAPKTEYSKLGNFKRFGAKRHIVVFASKVDKNLIKFQSGNEVVKEYPKKSGNFVIYKEVDGGNWFSYKKALKIVLPGQKKVLKQLVKSLETKISI